MRPGEPSRWESARPATGGRDLDPEIATDSNCAEVPHDWHKRAMPFYPKAGRSKSRGETTPPCSPGTNNRAKGTRLASTPCSEPIWTRTDRMKATGRHNFQPAPGSPKSPFIGYSGYEISQEHGTVVESTRSVPQP